LAHVCRHPGLVVYKPRKIYGVSLECFQRLSSQLSGSPIHNFQDKGQSSEFRVFRFAVICANWAHKKDCPHSRQQQRRMQRFILLDCSPEP
jgi:hypothetical protein